MAIELPEAKPDTMEEVFTEKFQYINLDHYNIYHFEEMTIDGRRYQFRLSGKGDTMTVVTNLVGRAILLVSVWTNMDYAKRLKEIHQHILDLERSGNVPIDFRGAYWRIIKLQENGYKSTEVILPGSKIILGRLFNRCLNWPPARLNSLQVIISRQLMQSDSGAGDSAKPPWTEAHHKAIKAKEKSYIDPETGYHVFTELTHLERGECCGNRCRHCPFNHVNCVKKNGKDDPP